MIHCIPFDDVMTESEAKTSTSKFLSVHSRSREASPAKSDCDSERPGKRRGLKWFKSIRKAVGAIGGFRKRSAEPVPVQRSPSVISIEKLDNIETVVIQDVRKDRPKGPPGRKRSSQMMKLNSQNKLVTVQSVVVEESESKDSLKEEESVVKEEESVVKEEESVVKEEVVENGVHDEEDEEKETVRDSVVSLSQDIVLEEEESLSALSKKSGSEVASEESAA